MDGALQQAKAALERIILDPRYHDILAVIKGARNGAVYGCKVRFPHALVMILLFRSGTIREKAVLIFRATRQHARNLAKFATIYKLTCLLLKHYGPTPGKEQPVHTLLAGALGGYIVFGGRSSRSGRISSVNMQIVIYVFARVLLALAKLAVRPPGTATGAAAGRWDTGLPIISRDGVSQVITQHAWPVFAAGSWGLVMWLFRWYPEDLQGSLRSSMTYIYKDSDEWDSLRNFLWHNK